MSLKKIFITAGLVIILTVSVVMFYLLSSKKEKVDLQEQSASQSVSSPAVLPSGTESSAKQGDGEKGQKTFESITQEPISGEITKEGLRNIIGLKNQKGDPTANFDFENVLGIKIDPRIHDYLDNGYQTFYCPEPDGKKEFGIFLEYNLEKIYRGFSYDILDMLKGWEGTIFPDFHTVLYPNTNFSESELNQKIEFRNGKYRYAQVNLPGGKKGSIQYEAIEFGIIVSTSPSCLDNAYQYYEPNEPYQ